MANIINQKSELVPVGELKTHPENPRRGDVSLVAESIRTNGFYGAVVAQRSTGYVLAGNHRLMAADSVGLDEIPVVWVDVDDEQAMRILLADNRTSDLAAYDDDSLGRLLEHLSSTDGGLEGTGYSEFDLSALTSAWDYDGEIDDIEENEDGIFVTIKVLAESSIADDVRSLVEDALSDFEGVEVD